jgi:peptidoglycan/LPS O-acetylase OafA/YrhL
LNPALVLGSLLGVCVAAALIIGGRSGRGPLPARTAGDDASAPFDDPIAGGRSGDIPYFPAIDGLRALAVTAVILYHAEIGLFQAGFIGVDVFFVISGFLITSLLLAERIGSGRVSLFGFWRRRARRLLPAAVALITGVLFYTVIFLPDEISALRGDALASLGYVTNWYLILDDQSYFETLARPSLLRHLWSLAVEEQFYLLFPPIFALVLGRLRVRYAVPIVVAAAVASAVLMALLFEPGIDTSRIYYGTDTRIVAILVGSAAAFIWRPGNFSNDYSRVRAAFVEAAGIASLAGLIAISLLATESGAFLYLGGFSLVAILSGVLIIAAIHPGSRFLEGALARRPLVWLGTRSYSVYLWHWPVFMLTRPGIDIAVDGAELFAFRIALTIVLAEASFRLVESPIRNGSLGQLWASITRGARSTFSWADARRLSGAGFAGGLAVFLAISIAAANPPPPPMGLEVGAVQISSWSRATPAPRTWTAHPTPAPTPTPSPSASPTPVPTAEPTPDPTASALDTPLPVTAPPVTESPPPATAQPTVPPLPTPVEGPRVFAVGDSVMLGASSALGATISNLELDAAVSRQVAAGISILSYRRDAGLLGDVVVVHLGNNGVFTQDQMSQMMSILADVPRVVFLTVKVPLDWEGPNNQVIASASAYPNAVIADWKSLSSGHPEIFGSDGVHVGPTGASYYANLVAPLITIPEEPAE